MSPAPAYPTGPRSKMVTLGDLARDWCMDRKTVRRVLEKAGVQSYVFGQKRNGSVRYNLTDIERFLQDCKFRKKIVD